MVSTTASIHSKTFKFDIGVTNATQHRLSARVVWRTDGDKLLGAHVYIDPPTGSEEIPVTADSVSGSRTVESVEAHDFSVRTANCLERAGIRTFLQLTAYTAREIQSLPHANYNTLKEVKQALHERGLMLKRERRKT